MKPTCAFFSRGFILSMSLMIWLEAGLVVGGGSAAALTGGPDAFGYRFIDSSEEGGPAYNFEDISSSGTNVSLSDNQVSSAIGIGFTFNFYGVNYSSVYIGSNGFLTFLPGQSASNPTVMPDSGGASAIIAGWAAHLFPPDCGSIKYRTLGSSPSRRFIVQFTYIGHSPSGTGSPVTFEIKLIETTNDIEIHYNAASSDGTTHCVGIENEAGSIGLQYYSGAASLGFPGAVRFFDSRFEVSPEDDFYANGHKGGTFDPASKMFTLTNNGMTPLNWTATKSAAWLNLSATSGTLQPSASASVTVSMNANAAALNDGTYTDTVTFSDTASGAVRKRMATLLVSDFVSTSHPWPSMWYFGSDFYVDWTGYDVDNSNFFFWKIDQSSTTQVTVADNYVPVTQHALEPASGTLKDGANYFHLAATDTITGQIIPGSQRNFSAWYAGPAPEVVSSTHPTSTNGYSSRDLSVTAGVYSGSTWLFDGFESGNFGTLPWINNSWVISTEGQHAGQYCIRGYGSQFSSLLLTLRARSISFWYGGWPTCRFYVDGSLARTTSGGSYALYSVNNLSPSTHTFYWEKPGNQNYSAFMDDVNVEYVPLMSPTSIRRYWYTVNTVPDTQIHGAERSAESLPITWAALLPGTYWFHIAAEDVVGNLSQTAHYQFIVGADQPSVSVSPQSSPALAYPQRDVNVSWNNGGTATGQWAGYYWLWDDDYSTEPTPTNTTVRLSSSHTFTNQPIGVHYFHIRSVDKYGTLSPVVHQAVQIREATAPVISPTSLSNGVLVLTWSNPDSFATHYYYRFDHEPDYEPHPGDPNVINLALPARNEIGVTGGAWYAHIRGADAYGNLSKTAHWGVWAGPVSVSISNPSLTFARSNSTITYTVRYYGAAAVTLSNTDVSPVTTGTASVNSIQVSGSGTSTRTVTLSGFSGQGTIGIALASQTASNDSTPTGYAPEAGPSRTFSVDTVPPSVSITSQEPQFTKTTPIPVTVTFNDPVIGFDLSKLIVSNGQVQNLAPAGDDMVWHIDLVPAGDGNVTIDLPSGAVTDAAGNASLAALQFARTYDTTPPSGSVMINGGDVDTSNAQVALTLSATDGSGAGVTKMRFSLDGLSWGVWETYATTHSIEFSAGDGLKTVFVQFMDGLDNVSGTSSDTISLDATPPECSVVVNGGETWTNSGNVVLTITATDLGSGIKDMQVTNNAAVWSDPIPFALSMPWTLNSGGGIKTVWVKVNDNASNTQLCSAEINLDNTAPSGSVVINGGAPYTNSRGVTLTLSASDGANGSGVDEMRLSNDGITWNDWETFAASKPWMLEEGDGSETVYAQFRDVLGNASDSFNDTVTLDTTPPGLTLSSTVDTYVNGAFTVTATFTDAVTEFVSDDVTVTNATVSAFAGSDTSFEWTVTPTADGAVTVAVAAAQCIDVAGNGNTVSNTLNTTYDATPPTGSVAIDGDSAYTNSLGVTLILSASDGANGSGVGQMRLSNDGITWNDWEMFAASRAWTLTDGDGTKTVYAQFRDALLNASGNVTDTIILDMTPPGVALTSTSGAFTNAAFTVSATFTEAVSGFASGGVTVTGGTVSAFAGSGATYQWTVTPETEGAVTVVVGADQCIDLTGKGNTASNTIQTVYDITRPTLVIGLPSATVTYTHPVTYTVSYTDANAITLSASDITLNKTGTADGTITVSGDGTAARTVTLYVTTGSGTLGISVGGGTATDAAGNLALATEPSAPVMIVVPDINGDGHVNATDVQMVINAALGRTSDPAADVNGDGSVNAVDVQMLINAALGRI